MTITLVPELPCEECGQPRCYDQTGGLACENPQCSAAGVPSPLWYAAQRAGVLLPAPPGLDRPVHAGLPVPWITVITTRTAYFKALHAERQAACWNRWRCQYCGLPLDTLAWVAAAEEQIIDAPLHHDCLALARVRCPHLSGPTTRATDHLVRRGDILANGWPLEAASAFDPFFLPAWTLAPAHLARAAAPGRVDTGS